MTTAKLIEWAIREIRELDELARWGIAGYEPLSSDDMGHLKELAKLAEEFAEDED